MQKTFMVSNFVSINQALSAKVMERYYCVNLCFKEMENGDFIRHILLSIIKCKCRMAHHSVSNYVIFIRSIDIFKVMLSPNTDLCNTVDWLKIQLRKYQGAPRITAVPVSFYVYQVLLRCICNPKVLLSSYLLISSSSFEL